MSDMLGVMKPPAPDFTADGLPGSEPILAQAWDKIWQAIEPGERYAYSHITGLAVDAMATRKDGLYLIRHASYARIMVRYTRPRAKDGDYLCEVHPTFDPATWKHWPQRCAWCRKSPPCTIPEPEPGQRLRAYTLMEIAKADTCYL